MRAAIEKQMFEPDTNRFQFQVGANHSLYYVCVYNGVQ